MLFAYPVPAQGTAWPSFRHLRQGKVRREPNPPTEVVMDVVNTLLIGLAAGFLGTVVFTLVEYAEMAATKRPASLVPGQTLVAMTGRDPHRDTALARKANLPVHFAHGTALGAVLGALSLLDLSAVVTALLFYVLLLGGDWLLYSVLGITRPTEWSGADWAREVALKAVFAGAVALIFYGLLEVF
jgi:hypothetical protein